MAAEACTTFSFTSSSGARYLAKSFDWDDVALALKRTSNTKYENIRLVTVDEFGDHTTGGMNNQGLVMEALFCPETKNYQEILTTRSRLTIEAAHQFAWIQQQLNESKNVEEVIANLKKIDWSSREKNPIHYFVCDSVECAIIQFTQGRPKVFAQGNLPIEVLTNKPYEEALQAFQWEDRVLHEGGSQDRFNSTVRAAQSDLQRDPFEHAVQTLEQVKVDGTLMQIVYDIEGRSVSVKSRNDLRYKRFSLNQRTVSKTLHLYAPPSSVCLLNSVSE